MRIAETRDLFATEFEFPATREAVIGTVGDVDLDAPYGESETIGEVLGRVDQAEYASVDELFDLIISNVGDAFIGRKYYDDRGMNLGEHDEVSF